MIIRTGYFIQYIDFDSYMEWNCVGYLNSWNFRHCNDIVNKRGKFVMHVKLFIRPYNIFFVNDGK